MTHLTNFNCQATEMIHHVDSSSHQLLELFFRTVRNKRKPRNMKLSILLIGSTMGYLPPRYLSVPGHQVNPFASKNGQNCPFSFVIRNFSLKFLGLPGHKAG